MAKGTSSEKALRKSLKARERNKSVVSMVKSRTAKAEKLIVAKDVAEATTAVKEAISTLDKAVRKGVVHPNTAARRKSRLTKKSNQIEAIVAKTGKTSK